MTQALLERDPDTRLDSVSPETAFRDHVAQQTATHPLFRRRRLRVVGSKGKVVLTGTVTSFYEKQLAQEFIRRCDGVRQIDNQIEVSYASDQP